MDEKKKVSKMSNKTLLKSIELGIITKEQGDDMIAKGLATGFSKGKVELCKQVGNFLEISNMLNNWFTTNEQEINELMSKHNQPPIVKASINLAK